MRVVHHGLHIRHQASITHTTARSGGKLELIVSEYTDPPLSHAKACSTYTCVWTFFFHLGAVFLIYPSPWSILTKISSIALLWSYSHLCVAFQRATNGASRCPERLLTFDCCGLFVILTWLLRCSFFSLLGKRSSCVAMWNANQIKLWAGCERYTRLCILTCLVMLKILLGGYFNLLSIDLSPIWLWIKH